MIYIFIWFIVSLGVGMTGIEKKGGFWRAFILSLLLSPFIGFVLTIGSGVKNPIGCNHCGNKYNEVEYCALCGKNATGDIHPNFNG